MAKEVFHRLPRLCVPLKYLVELKPCFKSFTFSGKESVALQMSSGASEIELNARNISVNKAKFNGTDIEVVPKLESEKVVFRLGSPSLAGAATLDFEFTGRISDKMVGLYKSSYTGSNEEKKVMLATQFEPANARQAFPCWDEPDFKSVFSITLVVPKNMTAISNMPLISKVERDGNCVAYSFEDTPKMSSYLVAFAVGELEYVEKKDSDGVLVRVYSRPGYVSNHGQGEFALDVACRSLPFFGDYFGIRFPLPKTDLLAIPDFAGGAMENWGLITFRERALLADKDIVSPASRQAIALTVSHELAHMWFGNLVTMHWWTDLWLKEGFATWIEYLCVDHCFPDMQIWTHFTSSELASALRLDALANSHPIEVEVTSPDEIDEIFDTISYSKGSSLINMLYYFLGDEAFRGGLCTYLAKHAYGNAVTEDLWSALSSSSGTDVAAMMRPWTRVAGFPVVTVTPLAVQNNRVKIEISQTQYHLPPNKLTEKRLWSVPIVFTCCSENECTTTTHKYILTSESDVIEIPLSWSCSSLSDCLVRINADASGFYHVRYPEKHLLRLAQHMQSGSWPSSSRFVFINDGFALAKAGFIPISDWLKILPQLLKNEDSYPIWRCVLADGFSTYIRRLILESGASLDDYHKFLRRITRPVLDKLGFLSDKKSGRTLTHNESLLRSLLIMTAGAEAGDPEIIAEAKRLYDSHIANDRSLSGDLRGAVYTTVVRHGGPDVLEQLMEAYRTSNSSEERSRILAALGGAGETRVGAKDNSDGPTPLEQVINFCLDPNGPVRDQDRVHGLLVCASWSSSARLTTWNAVKSDWPHLQDIYCGQFLMARLIEGVLSGFSSAERIAEVKKFFDSCTTSCPRAIRQAFETMEMNSLLLQRDGPSILGALKELSSGSN